MNRKERRAAKSQNRTVEDRTAAGGAGIVERDSDRLFEVAIEHHQAGRQDEAERLCRQVMALDPRHAGSRHILGRIAVQTGRYENALELIGHAIQLDCDNPDYHNDLGTVLALCNRRDAAEISFRRAIAAAPGFALAHKNLGVLFAEQGGFGEAAASFERAVALEPDFDAYYGLGNALRDQGRFAEAETAYERAIAHSPEDAEVRVDLGNVLTLQGRLEDAGASYRHAISIRPDHAYALNNLGNILKEQGKIEDAIVCYDRALAMKPDYPVAHSNLLVCINYDFRLVADRSEIEARRWNERYGLGGLPTGSGFETNRAPERRLRIGYVSPDFRCHSVGTFIEPVLHAHDPAAVETFCYSELRNPDDVTHRLQARADHWHVTVGMTDYALAQRIRADRIDILVDLAGHTANNRLPMFAHRPAPIQATWLGYPGTTGLAAMDYRLVDAVTDPEDGSASWASEKLVRLPNGFLCYGPPSDAPPPGPPPCLASDIITFGSFNNLAKLSPETLDAWAALLRRLPKARLLLKWYAFGDDSTRALFHARFAARGIAAERIILRAGEAAIADHLAIYNRVDIALDPFPYNGTTTTCEALWMGVPVVTLEGQRHAGRVGSSLLGRLGLNDLVAERVEDYVEIAATLAADRDRLTELRQSLRPLLAASPLCDAPGFARQIEATYRKMWRDWCEAAPQKAGASSELTPRKDVGVARSRRGEVAERIAAFPFWYHRIELPDGLLTPGWAPLDPTAYQIPARLDGKRVLDVGAWDGYWTFEALKRGAREVVAIDDFSDYMGDLEESDRKAWATFDLCRDVLGYDERQCRRIEMNVYEVSPERLGRFDVVFFFGTLYHLRHPLLALDRLSAVCDGEIFVESAILDDFSPYRGGLGHGYSGGQAVMEFYPRDEYAGNHTNWFVPTVQCMASLLEAAGFGDCRGWKLAERPTALPYCRGFAYGRKTGAAEPPPERSDRRPLRAQPRFTTDLPPITPGALRPSDVRDLLRVEAPVILEVGAHHGEDTLAFMETFPKANVYAFEPDPRAIRQFKSTVFNPRVRLFEVALGAIDGTANFHVSSGCPPDIAASEQAQYYPLGWDQSGSLREPTGQLFDEFPWCNFDSVISVPVRRLDSWAAEHGLNRIDFIWADMQGAEGDLVAGGRLTLAKTRYLYVEYSNEELYEGQPKLSQLMSMLPDFAILHRYPGDVLLKNTRF